MIKSFAWKRFWCPRGASFDLSDRGFLSDPDGEWSKYLNSGLVTFEKIGELQCAVLLGEPGIGKSWTLQHASAEVAKSVTAGAQVMSFDLRSVGDEGRLMSKLFESETFEAWRKGDWILHVFLDSLDECLLRIDNVAALLADELVKQPLQRLRLRIACRTAPWPALLERELMTLFGDCHTFELMPLRRIDVEHAAEQSGIVDPGVFLGKIDSLDVSSFAIKPVTLKFLISTFLRDGDFPKGHLELYEKGCRILCEEPNDARRAASKRGDLSPEERLAVASRIAAVTQLCNRFAVFVGPEADGVPPEDVFVNDLVGGNERAIDEVRVSVDALLEVLGTGLFSSRGLNRIGWAHQTYAEFLAARYCRYREMPLRQVRSLIFHPSKNGRRLIPQVREVAGWMSAMDQEVLKSVAMSDPEALLGAASAGLSDDQRKLAVDSLLRHASQGRTLHLQWELISLFPKLKHAQLPEQLRPYLQNRECPVGARHVAVDIARACEVEPVAVELVDIALDGSDDMSLRRSAAASAAQLGSREERSRLRPLAFGKAGDDPDDEFKGSGLKALWPELITADELFPLLTVPKQSSLSGMYSRFLYDSVIENMTASDLPVALEWFSKQEHRQRLIGPMDRLMDRIVQFAWDNLDESTIAPRLAAAIVSRLHLYDSIISGDDAEEFANKVNADFERRRMLLTALLPIVSLEGVSRLYISGRQLLSSSDFEWMIDRILRAESQEKALVEVRLLRFTFDPRDTKAVEKLWYACKVNAAINSEFGNFFAPIFLDSAEAKTLRGQWREEKEWRTPKLLHPAPPERIENDLLKIEAGDMGNWVQLTFDLTLEPAKGGYANTGPNLTERPGWKAADNPTRKRIIDAALAYVEKGDPQNDEWFRTSSIQFTAIGGLQALALLMVMQDARFDSISREAWRKWVPILLRFLDGRKDDLELRSHLLRRANELVPDEVLKRILELIDAENERNGIIFLAKEIETCWDERLGLALLETSKSQTLHPQILGSILELLLQREFPGARELAESLIDAGMLSSDLEKRKAITAAQVLLRCSSDAGWKKIWPIMKAEKSLGREIVESVSYGHAGGSSFVAKLNEAEMGEFYLWMVEAYPYVERKLGVGAMGPGDTAVMLRDSILEILKKRASFAACDAIRHAMDKLPQHKWLQYHLEEAELLARAATWNPISSSQFLLLAQSQDKRFIETGGQLIDALIESLDRLHGKLHGELPAVRDLWNTPKEGFSPKDEQEVADSVARHFREDLRDRGIVVNREVQIRLGIGDRTGQRTDIYVDAVILGDTGAVYDQIHAIVEVKGNWNAELLTAMKAQLRDRYLEENQCRNGLYLVAWFVSAKWSDSDSRKKKSLGMSLDDARQLFAQQAADLSNGGYSIHSYVLDARLP